MRSERSCSTTTLMTAATHAAVVSGSRTTMSRTGPSRVVTLAVAFTTSIATIAATATRNGTSQRVSQPIDATAAQTTSIRTIHGHGDGPGTHTSCPDTTEDAEFAP